MSQAGKYLLAQDFPGALSTTPSISVDPYWIIAVIRLDLPLSFSRATLSARTDVDITQGVESRESPLIISSDCMSVGVSGSKTSPIKQLNAVLRNSSINYLNEILSGDWVMCWMVNNRSDFESLLARLQANKATLACNEFNDGLKFMGRVQSVRKVLTIEPSGQKSSKYTLEAVGFKELMTQFFYDPFLSTADVQKGKISSWLTRIGADFAEMFRVNEEGQQEANVNVIIPKILDIIVGTGVPSTSIKGDGLPSPAAGSVTTEAAPLAYLVPKTVANYLGISQAQVSKSSGFYSYADLLFMIKGIQTYSTLIDKETTEYGVLLPDTTAETPQRLITGTPMLGSFVPYLGDFSNRPVWDICTQYLNPTINELYTSMRVVPIETHDADGVKSKKGRIMPSITFRQIPFTTEAFDPSAGTYGLSQKPLNVTKFMNLPRWKLHGSLVTGGANIGRSNATRTNFIHIFGADATHTRSNTSMSHMIALNAPIRDDIDIQRSGLYSYMTTVACRFDDTLGLTPTTWMALVADWLMGSQYTFNGTIVTVGIQAPICEGDNLEWDGVVYHIEGVSHNCSVSPEGLKSFSTTIAVTNGMRDLGTSDTGTQDAVPIYPGFYRIDNSQYDAPTSVLDLYGPRLHVEAERPNRDGVSAGNETSRLAVQAVTTDNKPVEVAPEKSIEEVDVQANSFGFKLDSYKKY